METDHVRPGPAPDDWQRYRRYLYLLAKLLFYIAIAVLAYLALKQAAGVLSMMFISLLIAYVLNPIVNWFGDKGLSRSLAIVVLLVLLIGFVAGFTAWILPTLIGELSQVGQRVYEMAQVDEATAIAWARDHFGVEISHDMVASGLEAARERVPSLLSGVGAFLQSALSRTMGVIGWFVNALMIPVFVFYFLRDWPQMMTWLSDHLPLRYRDAIVTRGRKVDNVIGEWLRGQVEVALILAVLYAVGLLIVGIKLAIPIGILAGLLSVIPYLGFAFGFGLAVLIAILDWQGVGTLLGVGGVFAVVQTLEGYVITPKIVGEKIGLSPVTIIFVLLLGGELFGFLGFLLAVPVAGAVKVILVEIIDWYRSSEHYLAGAPAVAEGPPPTDRPATPDGPPAPDEPVTPGGPPAPDEPAGDAEA